MSWDQKKKDEAVCLLHTLADAPVGVFSYLAHRKKSLKTALWQQPKEHPGFELIKKSKRFFAYEKILFNGLVFFNQHLTLFGTWGNDEYTLES